MLVKLSTVSFSDDLVQGTESKEGLLGLSCWRCRILASFWVWSFTHSKISLPCCVRNLKCPSPVLQLLKKKVQRMHKLKTKDDNPVQLLVSTTMFLDLYFTASIHRYPSSLVLVMQHFLHQLNRWPILKVTTILRFCTLQPNLKLEYMSKPKTSRPFEYRCQ